MRKKGWTCQRVTDGRKCRHHNPPRIRKCAACGKARPKRKRPTHMAALDFDYEHYINLNGGEACGICGRSPSARRRLDRDHGHTGNGEPRGLLCPRCNRALPAWITTDWLLAAAAYLERAKNRLNQSKSGSH